ncbi:hypothetical protein GDO78_020784 [Eleutherodactylus coqui]|uniref:Uncharacterized protein n=1 Tax=Eleutherodactylus coqui TaxID=57060 RepID=A0A8J6BFA0_ELECQ|nr:hypothetical protein GDO78_020784 [Eleutherodactylus coqui]
MVAHGLLTIKLLITRNWKSSNSLSLSDITHQISEHIAMERIFAFRQDRVTRFKEEWTPWIKHFQLDQANIRLDP